MEKAQHSNIVKYRQSYMPKPIEIAKVATALSVLIVAIDVYVNNGYNATLYVLSITLIAIIWYTYFTYEMAHKKEEPSISATLRYNHQARIVNPVVTNHTNQYAAVKVWLKIRVNGILKEDIPDYCGDTTWHLTPRFTISGAIQLEGQLRSIVDKSFEEMVEEANDRNTSHQLQLKLGLTWKDMEGNDYSSPDHCWYFDFRNNDFVYQVGRFSDW